LRCERRHAGGEGKEPAGSQGSGRQVHDSGICQDRQHFPRTRWVDYRWLNPVTKTIEDKSAWIERMGEYFVGVGVYKNEQPNENTIGLISGSPNSDDTYLQIAYDLADVLNDGDNLRILPIAGIGGPKNIRDVRYLRGIDIGLTQTNILNNFRRSNERMGQADNKIVYITRLFTEEVHLVARTRSPR